MLKKIFAIFLIINIFVINSYISFAEEIESIPNTIEEESQVEEVDESDPLGLISQGAVLMELDTGSVLYDKNMNERMFPASITKILTAILVLENCDDLSETTTASKYAVESITNGYTTAGIKEGETFTIEQLLEVMMLKSANEAATILAEYVSGSVDEFAKLMNDKAKEIGAVNSNFLNANGMHDENHYSTPYDMALIERYCMQNKEFRRISALTSCSLPNTALYDGEPRTFKNTHAFLLPDSPNYYKYAIAGKTGFTTPAKNCLVTCANKDGFELVALILHAEGKVDGVSARYVDTKKLLDYGYDNYDIVKVLEKGETVEQVNIKTENGTKEKLNLVLEDDVVILTAKDKKIDIKKGKVKLDEISLPVDKGAVLGTVQYVINNETFKENVVAERSIEIKENVSKVTLETDKKTEIIAILLIFGLLFVAVIVIIIFLIVTIKEKRGKMNFS